MAEPTMHDVLAQLVTVQATVQQQGVRLARYERREQRGRQTRRFLPLVAVALLVALMPLSLLAASPTFSDLATAAPVHQPNIQAIGNAGISTGFADPNDPNARLYNPKDNVTREEMASFLARTAGLGDNPPVANAKTAQTADSATNATSAGNADTVGGYAPSGLARVARNGMNMSFQLTSPCATYVPLIELTITAPAAGFLLVNGAAGAYLDDTGVTALFMRPRVGGEIGPQAVTYPNDTSVLISMASVSWAFPVEAGARKVTLEGCREQKSGDALLYVASPQLTALFVPFGYDGGTTLVP
ncbi:MAG TPA: hypothetical protein VIL85_26435 [Thermomicrobiales bacterium]|jgi:hypothetical protein